MRGWLGTDTNLPMSWHNEATTISGSAPDSSARVAVCRECMSWSTAKPSVMALSPDRRTLYVGHRTQPTISSFRIDPNSGGLTLLGTIAPAHAPTFLAPDRTGRYLLCAYYQGSGVAVHPIAADGAVGAPPLATATSGTTAGPRGATMEL